MRAVSSLKCAALAVAMACGDAPDAAAPDDGAAPSGGRGGSRASTSGGSEGSAGSAGTSAGDAGSGGATSGAGGTGGNAGSGGSSSGGAGGDLGYDPADHCGPGMYVAGSSFAFSNEADHATTCNDADHFAAGAAGVFEGTPEVRPFIRSITLGIPMTAAHWYAMSFEVDFDGVDGAVGLELWGTTARCGIDAGATRMFQSMLVAGKQTICADITPSLGYTDVLLVLRDQDDVRPQGGQSITLAGATFCTRGACP